MLAAGRLTATMKSLRTDRHITISFSSCKKVGERQWDHVAFVEASHVFINGGSSKVGTYYPKSGKIYWKTRDQAWRFAAIHTLRAAMTGVQATEQYEIAEANLCGKCARTLTDPVSIARGIGPTCYGAETGSEHYTQQAENLVEDLSPATHHQRQVARRVLETNDVMNAVLGGPSREEAEEILQDKRGREVPRTFEALAAAVKGGT